MKILIRLIVLSGLLGLASWSSAAITSSKNQKEDITRSKAFGVFGLYEGVTEGAGVEYSFVGGDTAATEPKINLWADGSTGVPELPPPAGDGEVHGQTGGWVSLSATPSMDWSAYSAGSLKLNLCVPDDQSLEISFKSEDPAVGEWMFRFARGEEKYGLVRGAKWSQVTIPLKKFTNYRSKLTPENLSRIKDPFVISGNGTFAFSQVYLSEK